MTRNLLTASALARAWDTARPGVLLALICLGITL